MKKTFLLRVAALLMAMLMVLAVFAGCKNKKEENDDESVDTSASAVFRNALVGFVTDLGELPVLKTWLNMCQHGSLELDAEIDAGELAASMGETGVSGSVGAGYKMYFNSTEMFVENLYLDIKAPKENIDLNVSGDIYFSPDYLYVKNDNILGGAIGLISGETGKAFENSEWKHELDKAVQDGSVPTEVVDILMAFLKMYDGEMGDVAQDVIDDIKPVAERYITVITASLEKNAKFVEKTEGDDRVITLVIDNTSVVGFINDLYAAVKDDAELRSLVVKYGDMLKDYTGMTGAELGSTYDELLAQLGEQMGALEEEIPAFAVMVAVTTPTDASTLRKLEISMRDGDESNKAQTFVTLDVGKNGVRDTECITLDIMGGETVISYKIDQNDENGYKASLIVSYMTYPDSKYGEPERAPEQETMTCFTIDVNNAAGTYSLSIPELDFAMGGTFKVEGDKTTIVFNSITLEKETYNKGFSLTMIVKENDTLPTVVDKKDVINAFDLDKDDIANIVNRAKDLFGDLIKDDEPTPPVSGN